MTNEMPDVIYAGPLDAVEMASKFNHLDRPYLRCPDNVDPSTVAKGLADMATTIATLTAEKDKLKAHRDRYAAKCDRLAEQVEQWSEQAAKQADLLHAYEDREAAMQAELATANVTIDELIDSLHLVRAELEALQQTR